MGRTATFVLLALIWACSSRDRPGPAASSAGQSPSEPRAGSSAAGSEPAMGGSDAAAVPEGGAGSIASDAGPARDAGASDGGSPDGGGPRGDAGTRAGMDGVLCDGSPGITFAAVIVDPHTGPMNENGSAFLIVEGTCRFFGQTEMLDHVVTGTLTDVDLQRLRADFQLESWTLPTRHQTVPEESHPYYFYTLGRFEEPRPCVPWRAMCMGPNTRAPVADMNALVTAFYATLDRLRESATPVSGDVRYVLANHHGASAAWPNPAGWPLGDPAAVAVELGTYTPGTTRLATGDDAAALREIWRQFLDFEITGRSPGDHLGFHWGIPIEADRRYMLMIRDRLPIENELGLIEY